MDINEAFKIISRQCPCPHETTIMLGFGESVRCEDCGTTVASERLTQSAKSSALFDEAIEVLWHACIGGDVDLRWVERWVETPASPFAPVFTTKKKTKVLQYHVKGQDDGVLRWQDIPTVKEDGNG